MTRCKSTIDTISVQHRITETHTLSPHLNRTLEEAEAVQTVVPKVLWQPYLSCVVQNAAASSSTSPSSSTPASSQYVEFLCLGRGIKAADCGWLPNVSWLAESPVRAVTRPT